MSRRRDRSRAGPPTSGADRGAAPPRRPAAGRNRAAMPPRARIAVVATLLVAAVGIGVWLRPAAAPLPDLSLLRASDDPAVVMAVDQAAAQVERTPGSAPAWGELGLVLRAHGDDDGAVACFMAAADRDGRSWRWPFFAAVILAPRAPDEAVALAGAALARDPQAVWPRLLRGEWLATLGRTAEARADFEAVVQAEPGQARARLGLARVLVASGNDDDALGTLRAVRDDPTVRRAAREIAAAAAARAGSGPEAARLLEEAAALPPDAPWPDDPLATELPRHVHGKRGLIALVERLERDGALDRAKALTRRLESEHPDVWHFIEGRLLAAAGNRSGAEEAYRAALAIDPGAVEVHWALARLLAEWGKRDDATAALTALLRLEPTHGPACLALGRLLLRDDREGAIVALRSAVAYMPASEEARRELADAERAP